MTFGGGPRICIGINFAQIETKALAAYVLRRFQLEAADDRPLVNAGHLTALPDGIRLRVHPKAVNDAIPEHHWYCYRPSEKETDRV